MAEKKKSYRLSKVMTELNVGSATLVEFLNKKGFEVEDKINTKLSPEMYEAVLKEFDSERKFKEKAEQVKDYHQELKQSLLEPELMPLASDAPDVLMTAEQLKTNLQEKKSGHGPTQDNATQSAEKAPKNQETQKNKANEATSAEAPVEKQAAESTYAPTEETSSPGLKVVGKVDLDSVQRGKRGKASAKPQPEKAKPAEPAKVAEPKEEQAEPTEEEPAPKEEQVVPTAEVETPQETPAEPEASVEKASASSNDEAASSAANTPAGDGKSADDENVTIENSAPKLQGLTVKGKIDLSKMEPRRSGPKQDDKSGGKDDDQPKRKRKRKRSGPEPIRPESVDSSSTGKGAGRAKPGGKREVSGTEVQQNVRSTLSNLGRGRNRSRQKARRERRDERARRREQEFERQQQEQFVLEVTEYLTANELANLMDVSVNEVIASAMQLGYMVSINQRIEKDLIELISDEFGFEVNFKAAEEVFKEVAMEEDDEADLQTRQPIVTVMGHVDHGKTSLLDHIREANVIAGEAGGITQHIGAYAVQTKSGHKITFLDTPGHEAFTAMRARGAQVTDIAIIVVAADDRVMPQTKEAINHAEAAGVPIVFAINKVDKDTARPEKIKEELANLGYLVEDWGGKYQSMDVSAKTGLNVDELLEKVQLESELLDLKANPDRMARGTVIEAQLDKGRGVVTTILVQTGTLRMGDVVLANAFFGRVKAMMDERGQPIHEAGPAQPVQILGLPGVPTAGDRFQVMESDKEARQIATKREQLLREQRIRTTNTRMTLEKVAAQSGNLQELNIIVKGDVDGSVEALADSLIKLSNNEVVVNIVMKGVGQVSESDVLLASASDAIIIAFQVRPSVSARKLVQEEEIDLRQYSVIYDAINEVRDALEGMLEPEQKEEILGAAEVREVFKISGVGAVAGCRVVDGSVSRNNPIRLIRDGVVAFTGEVDSLKRHKDDVKEVQDGYECGISIVNFNDIKVGDVIESFHVVEVKRTLETKA